MKKILVAILMLAMLSFTVCVAADEDVLETVKNSLVFSQLSSEPISEVTQNLTLVTQLDNCDIFWESSDSNLLEIDGNSGIVKRPPFGEGYGGVLLSAHILYGDSFLTKRFVVRIKEQDADYVYSAKILQASREFDRSFMTAQDITGITNNLIIPASKVDGVDIECFSSNADLIEDNGKINFPYDEDNLVTLFVNFSCGYERMKRSYPIIVKAYTTERALELAQEDALNAIESIRSSQNISRITSDLELPSVGVNGSLLSWSSSASDIISSNGQVSRNNSNNTVVLTVEASCHGVSASESLTLTVLKHSNLNSDGGGASASTDGTKLSGGAFTETIVENKNDSSLVVNDIFNDISESHWAYEAILYLYNQGVVNGNGESFFSDNSITRSEAVKMTVAAFNLSEDNNVLIPFDDVSKDMWDYTYIKKAYSNEIIKGMSANYFGRTNSILRQDFAVILYNTIISKGYSSDFKQSETESNFFDEDAISQYALDAVRFLKQTGIVNGRDDNRFAPTEYITRAEASKMIYEILRIIGK